MANQGKIWLVVKPTVGLPVFFAAIAVTALTIHLALAANTTWFPKYWNGAAAPKTAALVVSPTA